MTHEYIPGETPLRRDDQLPPPLQGTPAAGSPGMQPARQPPPENLSRIERLIHDLGSEDWTVCTDAQTDLTRMGSDPVEALCEALKTGDWNVRWRAAWVLGRIADVSAVPPLCAALKDKFGYSWEANLQTFVRGDPLDGRVVVPTATREQRALLRMEAAEALGRIGEPEAIPALCGALWDGFEQVRERSCLALAQIGEPALDAVLEVIDGTGTEARVWAVRALSHMGEVRAIPVLIEALEDRYGGVRVAAAEALEQMAGKQPVLELRGAVPTLRRLLSPWSLAGVEGRAAYGAALAAIEQSTAVLRDLPLPAVSSAEVTEALPLPAYPHTAGREQLPLPAPTPGLSHSGPPAGGVGEGAGGRSLLRRFAGWLRKRLR